MNQINAIKPYYWEGLWVFDDADKGLDKEALVSGMPELIEIATKQLAIKDPQKGFVALFSKDQFPGAQICLDWVREDMSGNVYEWKAVGREGWLCPALFHYFDGAPKQIHIQLKDAQ